MTSRRALWVVGALGVAFLVLRVVPFVGAHTGRGTDSYDYLDAARVPFFSREFLGGSRPWGYPLYLKLVGRNQHVAVVGQLVLGSIAWLALALMAARATRDRRLAPVAAVAVLAIGSTFDAIQWDRLIGSEALSNACGIGMLAALLWLRERWTGPRLALIGVLALFATGLRDSNGSFFGVVAVVLAVGVLVRVLRPRLLGLAAVLLAVAVLGSISASSGHRWAGPLKDVITIRLLESPEQVKLLQHSGIPLTPTQIDEIKGNCVSGHKDFPCLRLPDAAFYSWIREHGRSAYMKVLLRTPATTVWQPLAHLRDSVGTRVRVEVGTGSDERAPVASALETVVDARNPALLAGWAVAVLAISILAWSRRRRGAYVVAAALVALVYPHLWLVWIGGALEVARHSLLASLQLRIGLWLGTVWLVDAFLAREPAPTI